jgi:hypothetical protein
VDGAGLDFLPPSRSAAVPDGGLAASMRTALRQWWLRAGNELCMAGTLSALARAWSPNMEMLIPPNHGPERQRYCSRCPEKPSWPPTNGEVSKLLRALALSPVNTSKRVGMKSPLLTQSFSTAA